MHGVCSNMKNKVLVLGGSSDIGIAVIRKLLKKNYDVTAHFSSNNKNLKKKFKNINLIKVNFSSISSKNINSTINKKKLNNFNYIINLVGYIDNKSFLETNLASMIKSLKINALIPMLIIRSNLKNMEKRKFGRILNCSTIGVKFGGGEFSFNYNLAKHCLEFIPNKFKYFAEKNVLINNLRIGFTDTKIHNHMKKTLKGAKRVKLIPIKRMSNPDEISEYIISLISEKNSYMTGQTLTVAGGE